MNHIELFAGCGGLSLGLETAGFKLLVANELSPMASETFAYNHLNADLERMENVEKVYWISSRYNREEFKSRLRENPNDAVGISKEHSSDIGARPLTNRELERSLFVGSITDLNTILERDRKFREQLKSGLGGEGVDLVSGGPPCQSFSLAGLRQHSNNRNKLPWEFAKFVEKIQPKIAMLENVSGILRAFKLEDKKYYAWHEIAKAFAEVGYVPLCLHVNAKYVGTAQNRPRFILISFRKNVFKNILRNSDDEKLVEALKLSKDFFNDVRNGGSPSYGSLPYYDIEKDHEFFSSDIFASLRTHKSENLISVKDAIDDLRSSKVKEKKYVTHINSVFDNYNSHPINKNANHNPRSNNDKVRARFRLYQIMNRIPKASSKEVSRFLKSEGATGVTDSVLTQICQNWLLDVHGEKIDKPTRRQVLVLLSQLYTKKQTQKALRAQEPAPAALSIPDDACHYHESVSAQRTLTVREMARIQSFPDWFEIKSKVTTGGQMRRFEVPQYTQIGNAVPPLLGLALGEVCKKFLEISE